MNFSLNSLNRDYYNLKYCQNHQALHELFENDTCYLQLIPNIKNKICSHFECKKCNKTWWMDYEFYDDNGCFLSDSYIRMCACKSEFLDSLPWEDYEDYLFEVMPGWSKCKNKPIYSGYFDINHSKYYGLFHDFLEYQNDNKICGCFWPENSTKAASINDVAYGLFKDLISETAFYNLIFDTNLQKQFTKNQYTIFNERGLAILFVSHSFLFSHYLLICQELEWYSQCHFSSKEHLIVKDKIEDILEKLSYLFLDLYTSCSEVHNSERIFYEIWLIESGLSVKTCNDFPEYDLQEVKNDLDLPRIFQKVALMNSNSIDKVYSENGALEWKSTNKFSTCNFNNNSINSSDEIMANILLIQGITFSEALLYDVALNCVNESISLNPLNCDACIERAYIYFEIGKIDNAIKDYETAIKLKSIRQNIDGQIFIYDGLCVANFNTVEQSFTVDYELGLIKGAFVGAQESAIEFIPSTLSTIRGIGNCLWAFTQEPFRVTQEFIDATNRLIEFIKTNVTEENLKSVVPEFRDLISHWENLPEYDKGYKIGYIVGKYGIDFLIPGTTLKAIKRFREFRRANALLTLERCFVSNESKMLIVKKSLNRYALRKSLYKSGKLKINWSKQNKHIPGSPNYIANRSEITISNQRLQELVLEKGGTGTKVRGKKLFDSGYKERINFGEEIGVWVGEEEGKVIKLNTNNGIIHYAKDDVHVVPARPS